MAKVVEIDELASYLTQEFSEYAEKVDEIAEDECKRMANEVKKDLSNNVNIPVSDARTKHYKDSFAVKKAGTKDKWHGFRVYNKKYQLTHLLEYGHATVNGGRTRAYPHWEQANRKAQEFVVNLKKRLEANK